MQNAAFDQTFAQRLARVNLSAVMAHVAEDTGFDAATLARAEDLYRKFLTLAGTHPGKSFVPPRIVDIVWHTHITFTRQYMADCELLFGAYLHHEVSTADTSAAYEQTIAAYQAQFGVHPANYGISAELSSAAPCSL